VGLTKSLTALFEMFAAASPVRRLLLALLPVLSIAAMAAAYLWLNPPPYKVLYVKLSDRSGGEVMAALERLDISYRLSEANGAIEVPVSQLYSARFKLAALGLPKPESHGLDALDQAPAFGLSQFQEQLRYQRALEADLARSVESLAAVATARVHLALPKSSPFLRDPPPATAMVLVRLKSRDRLADEQVSAIRMMVAASVPRLRQSDVSVLDQQGRLLSAAAAGSASQDARAALERDLARRVTDVLVPWLGADKVKVQVTATLADSETEQTVERYRSVTVAGEVRPLEKSVRTTRAPEGRLRRLNAAVILAFDATPEQIEKATTLTRQALGFDARRGDSLSVFALPADELTTTTPPPQAIRERPAGVTPAAPPASGPIPWPYAAGAIVLVAGLFSLGLRLRRAQPAAVAQENPSANEAFDSLLQASRRQTLENPRVTADVVKLWIRA
jgi:flagellar M-ring protein FliF